MEKKTLNYITFDIWWDTDATILPELCKKYEVNVFVEDNFERVKYPVKEDYGFNKFVRYKAKYSNKDVRKMFGSLKYLFAIVRNAWRKDSTNLLILGGDPYLSVLLYFLLSPKRTVMAYHNYNQHVDSRRTAFAIVYKWYYHRFKNFLFFSELQRNYFLNDFPGKNAFCLTMPLKDFGKATRERTDYRVTFLFFGSIRPYKRPDLFIKAANEIPAGKARFIIAGSGKDWCKYEPLIKDPDRFELNIRFVDNSEIPDYFCQSDFLVLPYDDATQSGPSLIALNYGVPIIASKIPAFKRLIEDGKNGYLFEPGDDVALAALFSKIIEKGRSGIDDMRAVMLRAKEDYQRKSHGVLDTFNKII